MNKKLSDFTIYPTTHDVPADIRIFQGDVSGAGGVQAGVRALLRRIEPVARWVVAGHPNPAVGQERAGLVFRVVTVGLGRDSYGPCLRFVGEGNRPNGAGSSSVLIGGLSVSEDEAYLAAVLAMELGRLAGIERGEVFRVTVDGYIPNE